MSNLNDNAELKDTPVSKDYAEPVDLTNCDREPIHILGRVQSFGALLAISPDWLVNHASLNLDVFRG